MKKVLKLSKEKFANALIHEGIPLGINYGCVVSTWDWAKKYLRNKFISKTLSKEETPVFICFLMKIMVLKKQKIL